MAAMNDGADRLHAIDLVWLEMQGDGPPIAIGTIAVAQGDAPTDDELLSMVADRLDRMPRLHQHLTDLGIGLRRPEWVEDQGVDLAAHLHRLDASAAGVISGLDAAVSHIMEQRLPPDQPLWDMWVVEGLEDRWALVWRVHHTIADGVGALILLGHGFDREPDGGQTLADAILAGPVPRAAEGDETPRPEVVTGTGPHPLTRAADLGHDLGHALGALRGAVPHVIPAASALIPRPPSPLAGPVGPRRVWVSVDIPLTQVKSTGRCPRGDRQRRRAGVRHRGIPGPAGPSWGAR